MVMVGQINMDNAGWKQRCKETGGALKSRSW